MAIPASQLLTWTNQGAVATAKATHESVRAALKAHTSKVRDMQLDIFLQGSYRNDTNIYGDMDVDIVVQRGNIWYSDVSKLNLADQLRYHQAYPDVGYSLVTSVDTQNRPVVDT